MANCAECTYLDLSDYNSSGAYWCDKKLERHLATDPECGSFCRAYRRSYSAISNAIDYSNSKNSGGNCYLTTMLCNILGMDDNNIYLKTIREFRNNILQKNEKYKQLLVEYDIIGPKIAEALYNDPLKDKIAKIYFENSIIPITLLINNKEYDKAINLYSKMTLNLKNFYSINNISISVEDINNADIEKSGHGKYIQKKITL